MTDGDLGAVSLHECPGCGVEMYVTDPDRFCIKCHSEGRA